MMDFPVGEEPRSHEIHWRVYQSRHRYQQYDGPFVDTICELDLGYVARESDGLHGEVDNQAAEG